MNYKEQQKQKAVKLRDELFRDPGDGIYKKKARKFVLTDPELNIWCGFREDVLNYFMANKITWWDAGDEPTGHLLSSQIACLNHLYFLRQRKEDGLVDLAFAPCNNFDNILSLHEKPEERIDVILDFERKVKHPVFYPRYYSILVEHENNIMSCFEEMAKLAYCRARLKVVITYNWNMEPAENYSYVEKILVDNFQKLLQQANEEFAENEETEFMLIVGQLDEKSINWNALVFDSTLKKEPEKIH